MPERIDQSNRCMTVEPRSSDSSRHSAPTANFAAPVGTVNAVPSAIRFVDRIAERTARQCVPESNQSRRIRVAAPSPNGFMQYWGLLSFRASRSVTAFTRPALVMHGFPAVRLGKA